MRVSRRADVRVEGCVLVLLDGWMVVRFVGVARVPLCARVSCVRPVCVPAPPVSFYRYLTGKTGQLTSIVPVS